MTTNWPELINNAADRIAEGLPALADQLGTASEAVWPVLMRQVVLEAGTNLGIIALFTALLFGGIKLGLRAARKSGSYDKEFAYGGLALLGSLGTLLWVAIVATEGSRIVSALFNPQYAAAMKAMELLK